jgi:hypothetical protein
MVTSGRQPPTSTPVPSPTVFTSAGGATGPWARAATPPPLPPATAVFEPPRGRGRGKRRWWIWIAAAALLFSFLNRDRSKSRSPRGAQPSPSAEASVEGDTVDADARVAGDDKIEAAVQRALRANPRTRRQEIEVDVDEGIVTLSGHAPAGAAREAETMARRTTGVHGVVNAIEVDNAEGSDHKPHAGPPGSDVVVPMPPFPPVPRGRPAADAETVRQLLREAHEALKAGDAGEAMGKFAAVMGIDPSNEEARQGMKDATAQLGENIRRRVPRPPPSPRPQ